MFITYCIVALVYAPMLIFSGVLKVQEHPQVIATIHQQLGVPLAFLPLLAACEIAAAAGLLAGIRWANLGIAAASGAVVYFVGAILSHLRVGDVAGTPGAIFMLVLAVIALATRLRSRARRTRTAVVPT